MRMTRGCLWAVAALYVAGCGPSELPVGSVAGTVTLSGRPLPAGTITLVNSDRGFGASAEIDASGAYRIDTIPAGSYQVLIQGPEAPSPEQMAEGVRAEASPVPQKYQSPETSGLNVDVSEGANEASFELP